MKKILYVITKGTYGGAQRYVFDLAANLRKQDYEVVVASGDGEALHEKLLAAGIKSVRLQKLKESRRAFLQLRDFGAFSELLHLFFREEPDIVHLSSSRAALLGACAARLAGVRTIIFTAHGWPFKEPRMFLVRALVWLASYLTTLCAHRTIVLSEGDLLLGKKMPFIRSRCTLIYNGIDTRRSLWRDEARTALRLPMDAFIVGTIAALNRNKGVPYLIEALALLPEHVKLCLIGDGEDRKKLEALAHFCGVAGRVYWRGAVEDAARYVSAFDIFTLPSLKEGLPYSILEAGMEATPVVGTDIPGIRDIINTPEVGILVPPRDPRALGGALYGLIEDPHKRKNIGLALQHRVEQAFSLPRMLTQTLSVYER